MLFEIAASVKERISQRSRTEWEKDIELRLQHVPSMPSFYESLSSRNANFIFEIKRYSPSTTGSPLELNVGETAKLLAKCGANAISVLTEEKHFSGSLEDLVLARRAVDVPILRKDFIIDRLQISEAKAFGASAVLIIVALLDDERLRAFIKYADSIGLDTLVEIHEESELERAIDAGARIIGVNNRNLLTLEVDLDVGRKLLAMIPDDYIKVAESGIKTREDVILLREAGADAFLIGTAVMRSDDIQKKLKELMIR